MAKKLSKTQLNALSVELVSLRETKRSLEAREKEITDCFKTVGNFDGKSVLISVSNANRNGIDLDRLRSLYADVAKDCHKVTPVVTVSAKRK